MARPIATIALLTAMVNPSLAQDTKPALRIERCRTYEKSWAALSNLQQLTFAQLSDVIIELTTLQVL